MTNDESPAQQIDARLKELGDWRGETLARLRALIKEAEPEIDEKGFVALIRAAVSLNESSSG